MADTSSMSQAGLWALAALQARPAAAPVVCVAVLEEVVAVVVAEAERLGA